MIAILTLAAAAAFADEVVLVPANTDALSKAIVTEAKPVFKIEEKAKIDRSFGYLKMEVSDSKLSTENVKVAPGLGLGYRVVSGSSAIDISASYSGREERTEEGRKASYVYTLPKANYLYYLSGEKNYSAYAGGGLAIGGEKKEGSEFHGLIPNVSLGLEMNRNAAWRSFVQLDVSQPAIAASLRGTLPGAFAEVSAGVGF